MKILQLIPTLLDGGAEKFVCELSIELMNSGHNVLLVQMDSRQGNALPKLISEANLPHLCLWRKRFLDIKFYFRFLSLLIRYKPDVIHTHLGCLSLIFPAILFAKPKCCIHTIHTLAEKEATSYSLTIKKIMFKMCFLPIAVSKTVAKTVKEVYGVTPSVIQNGIKIENFLPTKKQDINEPFTFLTVGRLEMVKNNDLVVDAFAGFLKESSEHSNIQLLIIGKGTQKQILEDKIKNYGLSKNIKIIGFKEGISKYYKRANVLINASDYEGCSLSLIEALVSGLVIISRDIKSNREILRENAFYFNSISQLSELMAKSYQLRSLRRKAIKVEDFSIKYVSERYQKAYFQVLKNGRI